MLNTKLRAAIAVGTTIVLLLVEFSLFNDFCYPFRSLWHQGKVAQLGLSILFFIWSLAGAFLILFSGQSRLRKLTLPIFIFFYLFNIGSFLVSNAPLDFQQSVLVVDYFQWWFFEVIENFGLAVLPLFIVLVPIIIFAQRLPALLKMNIPKKAYFVPLSAVVLTILGLQISDGFFDRYPSFFRIPSMLVFARLSHLYDGERASVSYSGMSNPQAEKIVLIVDESIRGDILGINGYGKNTTPFLDSLESGVVNFGLAGSSSNCSDYANLILRTGLKKEQIPDTDQLSLKTPSIWQFTKKAGFYNVYLDAQSAEEWHNYQNFMNKQEAQFIDEIYRERQQTAYNSDGIALKKLMAFLKQPGKTFIMINKYGIHFPYFRSYPQAYNFFTPALSQGEPMNDREKSLNSYMNGLRWSVDDWFKQLLSASGEFRDYVMLYTSDHGQNIVDDGTLATHCRPRAIRFEGIVPMMVFSNNAKILEELKGVEELNYDKTSHFQIFPTLLRLAGYSDGWARKHYGASLNEVQSGYPEFFVGDVHGRGSVRKWVSIFQTQTKSD